jgi:outer membrane protein assembly factor BamB
MFGSEGLYCYDFAGNPQWSQDLGVIDAGAWDNPELHWGPASSPIIYKNLVFVQADTGRNAFLAALDLRTGRGVWSAERPRISSWSTPTVYEGPGRSELLTNGSDHIISYDPNSGRELWRLDGTSKQSIPTPFAAGGMLFFFSGLHSIGPITVVRPGGSGDITPARGQPASQYIAWRTERGAPEIPTPIVYRDHLYVCSNNGVLTCYSANTGERLYQERIAGRGGAFAASPIAGDGRIYLTSEDSDIHVIKAGPVYELLASNSMGDVCMATPAAARGMLIVRTQHHVFAIGEK